MAKQLKRPELTHCKVKQSANDRAPWRVWYPVEKDGKKSRVFKSFAGEDDAWTFAVSQEQEISNHGVRYGDFPPEARRAYDSWRDVAAKLRDQGAEVPEFADIISLALADIRARLLSKTVKEAVQDFLAYKETRVKERQLIDLRTRLKRFSDTHGKRPVASVTTEIVERWLASLKSRKATAPAMPAKKPSARPLAPLSRNHYRACLHSLFEFAAAPARKWTPRNPVAGIEPETVPQSTPQAYSPEDAKRILQAALDTKPELVPVLALGFFAGLRVSEAMQVDLAKLDPGQDVFRVELSKTGARVVPFTDACKDWLAAQPLRRGLAWTLPPRAFDLAMEKMLAAAGVPRITNGSRHSYVTYRCAETRNPAQVADECGNSPSIVNDHYRALASPAEAARYFAIRPETAEAKIIKIA